MKGRKDILYSNVLPGSDSHQKQENRSFQKPIQVKKPLDRSPSVSIDSLAETSVISRGRIAIFMNAGSLFYAALQLGITIDYSKLLAYLTDGDRLLRCFFYTGVDPDNDKQQGFLLWLRRNGYRVIAKELTQYADGSKKANVAVEIAVDMLSLVDHYDTAVLINSDGSLAYAVDAVSYKGVRVEVVGLRSITSESLIQIADRYIDLGQIKEQIQKAH